MFHFVTFVEFQATRQQFKTWSLKNWRLILVRATNAILFYYHSLYIAARPVYKIRYARGLTQESNRDLMHSTTAPPRQSYTHVRIMDQDKSYLSYRNLFTFLKLNVTFRVPTVYNNVQIHQSTLRRHMIIIKLQDWVPNTQGTWHTKVNDVIIT